MSSDTLLHYSRDALSGPLQELNQVIHAVVTGDFVPDNNRAMYFPNKSFAAQSTQPCENPGAEGSFENDLEPEHCVTLSFDESTWTAVKNFNDLADKFDQELRDEEMRSDVGIPAAEGQADMEQDEYFEPVSSSSSSSSQESDSSVDEEDTARSVLDLSKLDGGAVVGGWMHKRLGTLHKESSTVPNKLACGRCISTAYVKATTQRFSWTKCLTCFGGS
jgi:hypothetical protein